MQSKGKLGSILAGVIAVFLILVCAFYLSFTFVNSSYEDQAEEYAKNISKNAANVDEAYNDAYKAYMDSLGEQKVYLGYTLSEVRKWGVNLGLDLKGGMNVTLEVDMPDMMRHHQKRLDTRESHLGHRRPRPGQPGTGLRHRLHRRIPQGQSGRRPLGRLREYRQEQQ